MLKVSVGHSGRHLVHDLTVREKSGLDKRLEAVAYAEHETVAVLDEVCDGVLDARVSQHRGDELTGAVRLVASGESAQEA